MKAVNEIIADRTKSIEYTCSSFWRKIVVFQEKGYNAIQVWYEVVKRQKSNEETEIFPGIFATVNGRCLLERIKGNWRDKESIRFVIRNNRDRFEIIDDDFCNSRNPIGKEELISGEELVELKDIEYPNALGGGRYRCNCPITEFFHDLIYSGEYRIITESEIVEQTRVEPYFARLCIHSKCHNLLEEIKNNGYKKIQSDMIKIEVINGKMIPVEGKHRVCMLKRFGYRYKIPVMVTHLDGINQESFFKVTYAPNRKYVEEYYRRFRQFGLKTSEVRDYLINGEMKLCNIIAEKICFQKKHNEPWT